MAILKAPAVGHNDLYRNLKFRAPWTARVKFPKTEGLGLPSQGAIHYTVYFKYCPEGYLADDGSCGTTPTIALGVEKYLTPTEFQYRLIIDVYYISAPVFFVLGRKPSDADTEIVLTLSDGSLTVSLDGKPAFATDLLKKAEVLNVIDYYVAWDDPPSGAQPNLEQLVIVDISAAPNIAQIVNAIIPAVVAVGVVATVVKVLGRVRLPPLRLRRS